MNLTKNYKKLEKKEFEEFFSENLQPESDRGFVVHTGQGGYESYNKAIRKHFNLMNLNQAYNNLVFTSDEYESIKEMINSDDNRDVVLAESILETK